MDITRGMVEPLGLGDLTGASYAQDGIVYDHAIGGLPFAQASSDNDPYQRGLAEQRRQQIDTSTEPGEQSLEGWWLRSQTDFTGGSGITFLEPSNNEFVMRSFASSVGLDVWTPGAVSLLPAVEDLATDLTGGFLDSATVSALGGFDYICGLQSNGLLRYRHASISGSISGFTNPGVSLCAAGSKLLVAHATGADVVSFSGSGASASSLITGASGAPSLWWAKQRIMAAVGPALYEVPLSGGALPAPLYTHPNADWVWTSVAESPTAILAAGYAGNLSAVYKFTLDSSGALPVLSKAVTAADLPVGETVHGLFFYLGLCVLGTSKGVRVATVRDDGSLVYGPLSYESSDRVQHFAAVDRFVYFGVADSPSLTGSDLPVSSGLVRMDLSSTDGEGRYAWANDLRSGVEGSVSGVYVFPDGRVGFSDSDGSQGRLWASSLTDLTELGGELVTGQVRFNTLEPKMFRSARLRGETAGGTIVAYSTDGTTTSSLATFTTSYPPGELVNLPASSPTPSLGLSFVFTRDTDDPSTGPVLSGWQLRALPAVERAQILVIPLRLFDRETDQYGNTYGGDGAAMLRLEALLNAVKDGQLATYQNLNTGEQLTVQVEDVQFRQSGPSTRTEGFGGILTVRLRSV